MAFLSRLRSRSRDDKPQGGADEVRHLGPEDQDRLLEIARHAETVGTRRAAIRKLSDPGTIAEFLEGGEEAVRDEAQRALMEIASGAGGSALAAEALLKDTRHLQALARSAQLPEVRKAALERIDSAYALANLAKTAPDASVRGAALARVTEEDQLLAVALNGEHKDTAVGAMERLSNLDLVRKVAHSETSKAARRARTRLAPAPSEDAPPDVPTTLEEPSAEPDPPAAAEAPETTPILAAAEAPGAEPVTAEPPAPATPEPREVEAASEEAVEDTAQPAEATAAPEAEASHDKEQLEALCSRLEQAASNSSLTLRQVEACLRDARTDSSKTPPRILKRVRAARNKLFARAQELRDAEEWGRWAGGALQEELCRRIEELLPVQDLGRVGRDLRGLDEAWQRIHTTPPGQADVLRKRYQDARAILKGRIDADRARRQEAEDANRAAKEAICAEAEGLTSSTDWLKTAEQFKGLQERWKAIGATSRRDSEKLWTRFRAACDAFFTRRQEDRGRRKEEWARNLALKEELCVKAEALQDSSDWEPTAAEIRRLQASWKEVGAVRHNRSEQVWQRFRKACNAFFERYKHRDELARAQAREERETSLQALEALPLEGPAPENLSQTLQAAFVRARQLPVAPAEEEDALMKRLSAARDKLVAAHPASFRGTELDPEANQQRREKILARLEALATEVEALDRQEAPPTTADLAKRLKEALAARTIGGAADSSARRRAIQEEVMTSQAAWSRLGPVPGEAGTALETRLGGVLARLQRPVRTKA
jgi:hypothetical protein